MKWQHKAKAVLEQTALGSSMFATQEELDDAATAIAALIREAQAKAISAVGWQWHYPQMSQRETHERLLEISQAVSAGTHWEDA